MLKNHIPTILKQPFELTIFRTRYFALYFPKLYCFNLKRNYLFTSLYFLQSAKSRCTSCCFKKSSPLHSVLGFVSRRLNTQESYSIRSPHRIRCAFLFRVEDVGLKTPTPLTKLSSGVPARLSSIFARNTLLESW